MVYGYHCGMLHGSVPLVMIFSCMSCHLICTLHRSCTKDTCHAPESSCTSGSSVNRAAPADERPALKAQLLALPAVDAVRKLGTAAFVVQPNEALCELLWQGVKAGA